MESESQIKDMLDESRTKDKTIRGEYNKILKENGQLLSKL
jgi:hypothetical protein